MKTRIITTLAILAAGTLSASAQDEQRKRPAGDRGPGQIPPDVIEKFDKDGDGKLNETERKAAAAARKAAMEKRRAKMLEKYDTNNDGELDEDERKVMREDMEKRRKEILEKYDTDKDGKLSPEERKAAIDAGEDIPARPMRRGKGGPGGKGGKGGPGGKDGKGGKGGEGRPPRGGGQQ